MKNLLTLTLTLACLQMASAQEASLKPRSEFDISLSEHVIELKSGEAKDVTVFINRSRSYAKLKASMNVSSSLPTGVHVSFEPIDGVSEKVTAHVSVDETAKAGSFTIVINGTINYKNKGTMLKLIVNEATGVTEAMRH